MQALADEVYIPLDAEDQKSKTFDRAAIIVGGMAAQLGWLHEHLLMEITADEESWRMEQEFKRIYEQEINRLKPPSRPSDERPDDEPPGGLLRGM